MVLFSLGHPTCSRQKHPLVLPDSTLSCETSSRNSRLHMFCDSQCCFCLLK